MIFYGVLIILEKNGNEYLIRNFQTSGTVDARVKSITITIVIDLVLFLGLVFMIKRQKSDNTEVEGPDYKFANKLERPSEL
jgi:hypothetical protein